MGKTPAFILGTEHAFRYCDIAHPGCDVRNGWTINAALTLAQWPGNCGTEQPHHTLQLILDCTSCIWHPYFLWFVSLSINFCTTERKVNFFLPHYHLWCQMEKNYSGKVGNLTFTFSLQNDSCLYVSFLKNLCFGRSAGEYPRMWLMIQQLFSIGSRCENCVPSYTLFPFWDHFFACFYMDLCSLGGCWDLT